MQKILLIATVIALASMPSWAVGQKASATATASAATTTNCVSVAANAKKKTTNSTTRTARATSQKTEVELGGNAKIDLGITVTQAPTPAPTVVAPPPTPDLNGQRIDALAGQIQNLAGAIANMNQQQAMAPQPQPAVETVQTVPCERCKQKLHKPGLKDWEKEFPEPESFADVQAYRSATSQEHQTFWIALNALANSATAGATVYNGPANGSASAAASASAVSMAKQPPASAAFRAIN